MNSIEHLIRMPEKKIRETPLLFLHGGWHGSWCWESWSEHFLFRGYEVHTIDLPGHGGSPLGKKHINRYTLGDYVKILEEEIGQISTPPVAVGHSMGGGILHKYLETSSLPGAVLMSTIPACGMFMPAMRFLRSYPVAMLKGIMTLNSYYWVGTPELAKARFLSPGSDIDEKAFQEKLCAESSIVGLQMMFPFVDSKKIDTPVLVLAGEKDAVFTVTEERATAEKLNARFVLFEGQAHNLMMEPSRREAADKVDRWILDTLELK